MNLHPKTLNSQFVAACSIGEFSTWPLGILEGNWEVFSLQVVNE